MKGKELTTLAVATILLAPTLHSGSAYSEEIIAVADADTGDGNGESEKDVNVDADVDANESYMWTISKGAFAGALLGAAVGTTIWLIGAANDDPPTGKAILYPTAGGLVLGAGVGVWQVSTRDENLSQFEYDPFERPMVYAQAPRTYHLNLLHHTF